jgi:hypothetical protein
MSATVTAAQRLAVYDQLLDRLSGIGDIELAIQSGDREVAQRLVDEYADDLQLLRDLGLGDESSEAIELATPPEVLRRALPRLREMAERHTSGLAPELCEAGQIVERNRLVSETCEAVLAGLDQMGDGQSSGCFGGAMSLLPRLRQSCRGKRQDSANRPWRFSAQQEPQAASIVSCGRPQLTEGASELQGQDPRLAINCIYLSGILAAAPVEDKGRDGGPVALLLIAFPAPGASDTEEHMEVASCEVEVPAAVLQRNHEKPRAGDAVLITGQLSGGGGIIATALSSGPPDSATSG